MKVIVSGSSGGIGKAIANLFLQRGHEVLGVDILPSTITHPSYKHAQADIVSDPLPAYDPEIVIVCHGVQDEKKAVEVNLNSAIRFEKEYEDSPVLKSILFIASACARNGAEFPLYSASKGGLVTYMKNRAVYLAEKKVTVNAISPGAVLTSLNDHILSDKALFQAVTEESLLKKWATPEEIAEWAYFLTVTNKSMTGEDLLVDNGEMLKSNFIW